MKPDSIRDMDREKKTEMAEAEKKNMVQKTIIANYGTENVGKTTSVKLVYNKLHQLITDENCRDLHSPEDNNGDLCAILTINNIKVGVSSLDDKCDEHAEWLDELVGEECDIILAACHDNDETTKKIYSLEKKGYRILWTENARFYQEIDKNGHKAPKALTSRFNEHWAEEIANLIESWCYV